MKFCINDSTWICEKCDPFYQVKLYTNHFFTYPSNINANNGNSPNLLGIISKVFHSYIYPYTQCYHFNNLLVMIFSSIQIGWREIGNDKYICSSDSKFTRNLILETMFSREPTNRLVLDIVSRLYLRKILTCPPSTPPFLYQPG